MSFGDFFLGSESETKSQDLYNVMQQRMQRGPYYYALTGFTPEEYAKASPEEQKSLSSSAYSRWTQPYSGDLTVELSPLEKTSLAGLENWAAGLTEPDSLMAQAEDMLLKYLQQGPEGYQEAYKMGVSDPLKKLFTEDVLPAIGRQHSGTGFWSSERERADEKATEDLENALTTGMGQYYNQYQQNFLQALGLAPQYSSTTGQNLSLALAAGAVPRNVEESNIARQYTEFQRQQEAKTQYAQLLNQFVSNPAMAQKDYITTGGSSGILSSLVSGAGMAMGLSGYNPFSSLAGLFSSGGSNFAGSLAGGSAFMGL